MVQIDPMWVIGDLSIGLSGILPFILIAWLTQRFGRLTEIKSYWWVFTVGTAGFAAYLFVYWIYRLAIVDFGITYLYYITLFLLMIGVSDAAGMLLVTRFTGALPLRFLGLFLSVGLAVPVAVVFYHNFLGHIPQLDHPLPDITLAQGFMAWILISYSYFLLGRVAKIIADRRTQLVFYLAGFVYIGMGFVALYAASGQLYQFIGFQEMMLIRGVTTPTGAMMGLLAVLVANRTTSIQRAQPPQAIEKEEVPTGVPELDKVLEGRGLPFPVSLVVIGATASGKTTLVERMVVNRLMEGDGVIYLCLDNMPENIRMSIGERGLDLRPFEASKHLLFIDAYSSRAGMRSSGHYQTTQLLSNISIVLAEAMRSLLDKRKWIVIDSTTTILDEKGPSDGLLFLRTIVAKTRVAEASIILTYNSEAFPPAVSALVQETVDGTVKLKLEETKGGITRSLLVSRLKNRKLVKKWVKIP